MTKAPISLQDLRRRLYVKAKAEPSWRFWGLYVHVCKRETLREAYRLAKANDGAPGIDGVTFAAVEAGGVEGFLDQLREELVRTDISTPTGTEGGNTEGGRQNASAFDSDGDFIMHFPPIALRMPSESCLSCAPSLEASVRLFR